MDPVTDKTDNLRQLCPGRFTKVSLQTLAGEIEARLSEGGSWELRIRREGEANWRMACSGDLDSGAITQEPVGPSFGEEARRLGPLEIDPTTRKASVRGGDVVLANKEFALLLMLASAPDRVFSKAELLRAVWGQEDMTRSRTLHSHASRLRRKLRSAGAEGMIVNCWGYGYRFWDHARLKVLPVAGCGG